MASPKAFMKQCHCPRCHRRSGENAATSSHCISCCRSQSIRPLCAMFQALFQVNISSRMRKGLRNFSSVLGGCGCNWMGTVVSVTFNYHHSVMLSIFFNPMDVLQVWCCFSWFNAHAASPVFNHHPLPILSAVWAIGISFRTALRILYSTKQVVASNLLELALANLAANRHPRTGLLACERASPCTNPWSRIRTAREQSRTGSKLKPRRLSPRR